jgi:ankyrin repeat protein
VEAINVMVQMGVDKEATCAGGATALHRAADNGHVEVIKMLVQLGAQIDVRDANGDTLLQASIRNGKHQVHRC